MKSKNEHLHKRNEAIRQDFKELHSEGYKSSVIYERIANKYFMATITIDNIVWKRGIYKEF
jgi:hypothetical protein